MRTLSVAALLISLIGSAGAVNITTCNVTVPDGQQGILQADLDCGGTTTGVILERQAAIQMNGHTIRHAGGNGGIHCTERRCTVVGPGTVADCSSVDGAFLDQGVRFVVGELTVERCRSGIASAVDVGGTPQTRVLATDLTLRDNSADGARIGRFVGRSVVVSGNAQAGISASRRILGDHLTVSNNGAQGLISSRVKLLTSTVNGNAIGVDFVRASMVGSTLTGNTTADLYGSKRPTFVSSTCGHSVQKGQANMTLGVCTGD